MERTDRVELSTRGVDNVSSIWRLLLPLLLLTVRRLQDISYATDAFREWHLSNAFDLEAFKREFEVIGKHLFFLLLFSSLSKLTSSRGDSSGGDDAGRAELGRV